jgi:FixJ family two-component response regulator
MLNIIEPCIFFVDDDPAVRAVVARILRGVGIKVDCFEGPAACLVALRSQRCDLLITDLKMPEMDGIELLEKVKRLTPWIPVLVMSAYGDIPAAVRAIKAGAVDFIEKPLNKRGFVRKVKLMLGQSPCPDAHLGNPLTQVETEVLQLVIDGRSSKEIAKVLCRSTRTVEGHRSHLMHKLGAENLLDLLKRTASMGLIDMTTTPELARGMKILSTLPRKSPMAGSFDSI